MTSPERQWNTVSVVGVFKKLSSSAPVQITPVELEKMEIALGGRITTGQVVSDRGNGIGLALQSQQIDLMFLGDRIEARSLQSNFAKSANDKMTQFMSIMVSRAEGVVWTHAGYNFVFDSILSESAATRLQTALLREDIIGRLNDEAGATIKGAAVSIWADVDASLMVLQLHPHRESITSMIVNVNANFTEDLGEAAEFRGQDANKRALEDYQQKLESILRELGI